MLFRSNDTATTEIYTGEDTLSLHDALPFYRVPFDMSGIGWIMTANSRGGLPEPLLSRCPPLMLPALSLPDLIGFAEREGAARDLTAPALEAVIETLHQQRNHADALSLRVVQRMLDRAEQLERRPVLN